MSDAIETFINYWRRIDTDKAPYVHPDDKQYIGTSDFELDLLPLPMNGYLAAAEIVVGMLNPGLDPADFEWEKRPEFRGALAANVLQSNGGARYPFVYLNPDFGQHPGAGYWIGGRVASPGRRTQQKLKKLAQHLARRDNVSFEAARQHLASKVAVLQLLPYHSTTMSRRDLLDNLPSCIEARRLVHTLAKSGEKLVIIPRSTNEWGFTGEVKTPSLIVYARKQGASASLTPQSPGGTAVLRRISRVGR